MRGSELATNQSLSPSEYGWAILIAIIASLLFALVEVPSRSKCQLRACFGGSSFFYWLVLSFGNIITTLFASIAVVKLPMALASYYFLIAAFFGVFGFETILKNTNITMFDRGVLTIQSWIDKALNAAAAAAIEKQEAIKQDARTKLVQTLMKLPEVEINTRVLDKMGEDTVNRLEAAARASAADPKLYKVLQLAAILTPSEAAALLRHKS